MLRTMIEKWNVENYANFVGVKTREELAQSMYEYLIEYQNYDEDELEVENVVSDAEWRGAGEYVYCTETGEIDWVPEVYEREAGHWSEFPFEIRATDFDDAEAWVARIKSEIGYSSVYLLLDERSAHPVQYYIQHTIYTNKEKDDVYDYLRNRDELTYSLILELSDVELTELDRYHIGEDYNAEEIIIE